MRACALAARALVLRPRGRRARRRAEPPACRRRGDQLDGLLGGFALGGDRGPVTSTPTTMEFDYKTQGADLSRQRVVTQADMTLHSDTLRVTLDDEHRTSRREVVAEGKVQIDKATPRDRRHAPCSTTRRAR